MDFYLEALKVNFKELIVAVILIFVEFLVCLTLSKWLLGISYYTGFATYWILLIVWCISIIVVLMTLVIWIVKVVINTIEVHKEFKSLKE